MNDLNKKSNELKKIYKALNANKVVNENSLNSVLLYKNESDEDNDFILALEW